MDIDSSPALTRTQVQVALHWLAAELSHELVAPANFLSQQLHSGAGAASLNDETLDIMREEHDRLRRVLARLRDVRAPLSPAQPVNVLLAVEKGVALARERARTKGIAISVEVPRELQIRTDGSLLSQLCGALLAGSTESLDSGRGAGVRWMGERLIEIWVSDAHGLEPQAFPDVWVAMGAADATLYRGLAHRMAQLLGWEISQKHSAGRFSTFLHVPASASVE